MSVPFADNSSFIEIMDTTLRDGEQTEGVSFNSTEKLVLAKKLLTDLFVDRIEIASSRVSDGEKKSCQQIFDWAKKGNLYKTKLSAKRFGRTTNYSLGKLSGKASIEMALRDYGITLEEEQLKKILKKVIELGDKKENVTKEDLLFLLDENSNGNKKFKIINYSIISKNMCKPIAKIKVEFEGKKYSSQSTGDGGYDAFIKAVQKIFEKKKMSFPKLLDYEVRIPVGGHTDALVETRILWKRGNRRIETIGVSTDQMEAALKATEKMINVILKVK